MIMIIIHFFSILILAFRDLIPHIIFSSSISTHYYSHSILTHIIFLSFPPHSVLPLKFTPRIKYNFSFIFIPNVILLYFHLSSFILLLLTLVLFIYFSSSLTTYLQFYRSHSSSSFFPYHFH